jgi:hypothetical protein
MTLVANRAVLTQEADQLSMQLGTGCHGDLVWFRSPTLSWLPAHPISRDPFSSKGVWQICRSVRHLREALSQLANNLCKRLMLAQASFDV